MPLSSIAPDPVRTGSRPDAAAGVLGFFACAPDADYRLLHGVLGRKLPIPVVGGTSLGNPFDALSGPAFVSNLAFLGKRNVGYGIGVSQPLTAAGGSEQMAALYRDAVAGLASPPKLFVAILPILPDLFMDGHLDELFSLAGDTPVFGGMVSGEPGMDSAAVFANGGQYRDRMVLVGFAGDIAPAFGSGCRMTVLSERSPLVTAARDNVLLRVDDVPFASYLSQLGFDARDLAEIPLSLLIRASDSPVGAMDQVNAVTRIDPGSGAGILSSRIAVGSRIHIGILTRENIVESTNLALAMLLRDMEKGRSQGAKYDMVLAISCVARYYTMSAGDFVEAELLAKALPGDVARFGYYAFKEVCPVPDARGRPRNRSIGQSVILCAI